MKGMATYLLLCSVICGCGLFAGGKPDCTPVPIVPSAITVSTHSPRLKPRRIVVVSTHNLADRLREQDSFANSLAAQLKQCGPFDVVLAKDKLCREQLPMRRGVFDEGDLVELSRRYAADTVLYCEVDLQSAYAPMQLQANILMVNMSEAVALISLQLHLDARQPNVELDYTRHAQSASSWNGNENHLYSPSLFLQYAASRVAFGVSGVWSSEKE